MQNIKTLPYGSWRSPITVEKLISVSTKLEKITVDNGYIYWTESRPNEEGRTTILRQEPNGEIKDILPIGYSARTKVHEYGGAAFCVEGSQLWFCNEIDQRIYTMGLDQKVKFVSKEGSYRYAELLVDRRQQRLICVRECHVEFGEPENSIVAVAFDGGVTVLASGADFYSAPRLSPDGTRMSWIEWHHPNMPWDETTLMLAEVNSNGDLQNATRVTDQGEAVFQPEFGPDNTLYFVSDRNGWWNIYRLTSKGVECICSKSAEFGLPYWLFGMRTYDFNGPDKIAAAFKAGGISQLAEIGVQDGSVRIINVPHVDIAGLITWQGRAYYIGGSLELPSAIVSVDLNTGLCETIRSSQKPLVAPNLISKAQTLQFKNTEKEIIHGFYYPPLNPEYKGREGELPPLIVKVHGGPTAQSNSAFDPKIQFWTTRGFAILDVNYRGSTGFGRRYRQMLNNKWGIADVEDCIAGVTMLIELGLVDEERIAISGSSAGGYTALCALVFSEIFSAGVSYYGIGDLEALARDTHKFESHYLQRLVGKWPQERKTYMQRSPVYHANRISCPIIFFQGLKDMVVPASQAEAMVSALNDMGIPVSYIPFRSEGHGFRLSPSIRLSMESELSFYGQIFRFEPADNIELVKIGNLRTNSKLPIS